ncbi:uncharacterized protein SPSK_09696 [Sporothrix schenckii 1099-18]|uniref:Uncharacterized protein n=1 Tax=Sporothrix schenckii 1099-18 TaxID=1397361 RepID=A0A0F2M382_SPOSC|nr:uncharacterized protein SPSK_09696 [Sporothrix schenckii 1099-18]KJR84173.1 hypothetical protein SPSK_09696 [Sporothrix schenckii 1099-18]
MTKSNISTRKHASRRATRCASWKRSMRSRRLDRFTYRRRTAEIGSHKIKQSKIDLDPAVGISHDTSPNRPSVEITANRDVLGSSARALAGNIGSGILKAASGIGASISLTQLAPTAAAPPIDACDADAPTSLSATSERAVIEGATGTWLSAVADSVSAVLAALTSTRDTKRIEEHADICRVNDMSLEITSMINDVVKASPGSTESGRGIAEAVFQFAKTFSETMSETAAKAENSDDGTTFVNMVREARVNFNAAYGRLEAALKVKPECRRQPSPVTC